MGRVSQRLAPKKQRIQSLLDGVAALEARLQRTAPIVALRVRSCDHEGCGCLMPSEPPADALIISVGCRHQIPSIALPEGHEGRSRAERVRLTDGVGKGISDERQKRLLDRIKLL